MLPGAHLAALTGVRFVFALFVVLFHQRHGFAGAPLFVQRILEYGNIGVNLFFVLSGFVLAYNYFRDRDGRLPIRDFLVARFARIYPVYLLAVILFAPAGLSGRIDGPIDDLFSAIFLVQTWTGQMSWNTPGWSLSAEAVFYLLFPLVLLLMARLRAAGLVLSMTVVWLVGLIPPVLWVLGIIPEEHRWLVSYNPLFRLPEFVMGVAAGRVFLLARRNKARDTRCAWLAMASTVALVSLLGAGMPIPAPLVHNGILDPLFIALVYGLATGTGALAAALSSRPLIILGEASYSVYILQSPVFVWFKGLVSLVLVGSLGTGSEALRSHPLFITGYCVVLLAVSVATFYWLEVPARRVVRLIFTPNRATRAVPEPRLLTGSS